MDKIIRQRLLKIFAHMKERCYDKSDKRYCDWGGRGITICQEWLDDREKFVEWALNTGYELGLSIDRIDNDGDYCPENCRAATIHQQNNNRRNNIFLEYQGRSLTIGQWAKRLGMNKTTLWMRLSNGWSIERALSTPVRGQRRGGRKRK